MSEIALRLDGVGRTFRQGERELRVLDGASLDVRPGEIVALVGPSGAGKSTLLQIAGLLERPDQGDVLIAGQSSARMSEAERTVTRRSSLGFVYQYHHLLPEFSAVENIMLAQMIAGKSKPVARQRAAELLETLGIAERASHRPARLSGGEQQRVAIARAVANLPRVLLADEPTGNLDPKTADRVFAHLIEIARESRIGVLLATHNLALAASMDRAVTLAEGRITEAAL
ncbi:MULTISPECIES: ABC transporter ATP-binding protein [unclassified Minwuia]|jgi:lipoprotein-releasing system ATP-binding protein|uniref:ABC transporter ATP-binding protein n=1 Tax=unclassified Minwuia TaxID=2618799 RepID=UPI0024797660|nr:MULTISPECIES: ABC transporter ATP-binding protein [unclassified Minwuia]